MPRIRYTLAFRESAVAAVDAGESAYAVAKRLGISLHTMHDWLRLRQETGGLGERKQGVAFKLSESHRAALRELFLAFPGATNEQMVERLADATGVRIDPSTIASERGRMGFQRQKVPPPMRVVPELATGTPGGYRGVVPASRRRYPSDLTDAQWELIVPFIPLPKPGGRPIKHDRRAIVDAILYVLRTGCQWRALPHDFPPYTTVYDLFRQWRDSGVWERANDALRERVRLRDGRASTPSAAIIDSQVAKTTEKGGSVDMTAESA